MQMLSITIEANRVVAAVRRHHDALAFALQLPPCT